MLSGLCSLYILVISSVNSISLSIFNAIIESAKNGINTINEILILRDVIESNLFILGRNSTNVELLIDYLYSNLIINTNDVIDLLDVSKSTATRLIKDFIELEILVETTGFGRNKHFIFKKYYELFNEMEE